MSEQKRVAVIDLSLDPGIYRPVEHWSRFLGAPWRAFRPKDGEFPGWEEGYTHVLLTGSEASIVNREPWAERTADFVRLAVSRGMSVLGSCYGHQLLALALAGPESVRRCPEPEIGWRAIRRLRPSRLLGGEGDFFAFTVHFDEVSSLPEPFLVLASTEACGIQAFALKDKPVWGIQPHPEIDIPTGRKLLGDFAGGRPELEPLFTPALASEPRDSGTAQGIVRAFLEAVPEQNLRRGAR